MERLVLSDDHDEILRAQGEARVLLRIVDLPDRLEEALAVERLRAGFAAPPQGGAPLAPAGPEPY